MISREIILFPSNWIYNAGVIGFLRVLDELNVPVVNSIRNDGSVILTEFPDVEDIFKKWVELSPKSKKAKSLVYGWKNAYYANQTEKSIKKRIRALIEGYKNEDDKRNVMLSCCFCLQKMKIKKREVVNLNQAFGNILLGSEKSFVNMYWANEPKDFVCPKCNFIIMCHHLAFTPLSDGSKIFINAPSFKLMYNLNKFAGEIFGSFPSGKGFSKRNILAMSIIEYATKMQITLGIWARMNIEIISLSRHRNNGQKIEFFSLPYDVICILSDRRIASLLSDIGEFEILNMILEQKFSQLIEFGYDLLRSSLAKSGEQESFMKKRIMQKHNRIIENRSSGKLAKLAEKIFQLYALIEERKGGKIMDFLAPPEINLERQIEELNNQLREGRPRFEDFQKTYHALRRMWRNFLQVLEWAAEDQRGKEEFQRLYEQVAGHNASDLMESLKRTGFALKENGDLKSAFDRQAYRILELVRAGKRDDSFHALLRIFVAAKQEFPEKLIEAFKPIYSEGLFKVFLFTFLSAVLGQNKGEPEIEKGGDYEE